MEQVSAMIAEKVHKVFVKTFQKTDIRVDASTTADDIEAWDSLMHVTLLVGLEQEFAVRFSSREIVSLNSVGDMYCLLAEKRPELR